MINKKLINSTRREKIKSYPSIDELNCGDTVEVEKKVGKTKIGSTTRTSTSVTIPWSKVAGATRYRVYYKEKGTSKYLFVKDTTSLKYTIKGLKPATTYKFKVRAYKKVGSNVKCS